MAGTIKALIAALESASDLSIESLEKILQDNLPSDEEIRSASEPVLPYGRTLLALTNRYEVIIGCWPRNGWCDVHDHGEGVGIVQSYGGAIEHFSYELNGSSLELTEQCTINSGDSARLPVGMIHSLQNISSDEPYIGLHIYAPPASDVRVFDLKSGDIYHVTDDWASIVPTDAKYIRHKQEKQFTFRNLVHEKV